VFFIKDAAGRYLAVSHSLVLRTGQRSKRDLLGRHVREIFPAALADRFAAQDEAVLRLGRRMVNRLELVWHPRQRIGWCIATKLPLRNKRREIVGMVGYSRDVRTPGDREKVPARLLAAFDYLETNFHTAISPGDLAAQAGLSPTNFARLMKRLLRITPGQLILQTRLNEASHLLQTTDRSIAEIAIHCGFCDHSAFTRAFHAATGMTPTGFRRGLTEAVGAGRGGA
jgi:AraC-like DNA-binding protein